jgi:hypothetical protein
MFKSRSSLNHYAAARAIAQTRRPREKLFAAANVHRREKKFGTLARERPELIPAVVFLQSA